MNDMDEVFQHPERSRLSDRQFEMLMEARAKERATRIGLIGFLVTLGIVASAVTIIVLAVTGAFGG